MALIFALARELPERTGAVLLLFLGVAATGALGALGLGIRRVTTERTLEWWSWSALGAWFGAAVACFLIVTRARRVLALSPGDPWLLDHIEAASEMHVALLFASFVGTMVFVCIALGQWRARSTRLLGFFVMPGTLAGLIATCSIFLYERESTFPPHLCTEIGGPRVLCLEECVRAGYEPIRVGKTLLWALLIVGLPIGVGVSVRRLRHGRIATKSDAAASAGILAVGAVAFLATRGHAYDAEHLLPAVPGQSCLTVEERLLEARLPCEDTDAPHLDFSNSGVLIDGIPVRDELEAERTLRAKADLWRAINTHSAFPGRLIVAASPSTEVAKIEPWLAAARNAGYVAAGIYSERRKPVAPSATLGAMGVIRRCCSSFFPIQEGAPSISRYSTWGELHARP